jgi:signal transduction histidine kinase
MLPVLSHLLDGGAGELTAKQREFLEALMRSTERLEAMIASVADSGWLDCAAAPSAAADVPLGALVDDVLAMRGFAGVAGPPVHTRVAPGREVAARADREHVRRIRGKLLDNAARFTPESGSIPIAVRAGQPGTVELEISDDGCGIPAAEQESVFDFGFRGAAAVEAQVPGLGIGLWAARRLAESHGGSVDLESRAGAGTTCLLYTSPSPRDRTRSRMPSSA